MTSPSRFALSALALGIIGMLLGSHSLAKDTIREGSDVSAGGIGVKFCIPVSRCFKPLPPDEEPPRVRDHRSEGKVRDHRGENVRDHRGPAGPAVDPRAKDNGPAGPAENPRTADNGPAGPAKKPDTGGNRPAKRVSVDLNAYCSAVRGVKAKLRGNTVYDWVCYSDRNTMWGIDMSHACRHQHKLPVARFRNQNDPYSWYCKS